MADTEGFMVATPQGLGTPARWEFPQQPTNKDLPFFKAMIDAVGAQTCLDLARVYFSTRSAHERARIAGLIQPGEQVAVLVNRAALGRHVAPERGQRLLQPAPAVNNQELWLAQPALDEIVENGAPSLAGLATHVLDGQ